MMGYDGIFTQRSETEVYIQLYPNAKFSRDDDDQTHCVFRLVYEKNIGISTKNMGIFVKTVKPLGGAF